MVDTAGEAAPTLADQLQLILRVHTLFGFRPFEIVNTGRRHFRHRLSPFGLTMCILNLILFFVAIGLYYESVMDKASVFTQSPMGAIQARVLANGTMVLYLIIVAALVSCSGLLRRISERLNKVESLFEDIGWERPCIVVRLHVKFFLFILSFWRFILSGCYAYYSQVSFGQWFSHQMLQSQPTTAIQCCVMNYVVYILMLKVYINMLNEVLEDVRKAEDLGIVRLVRWKMVYN